VNCSAGNISWIFVPLAPEAVSGIRAWIHRLPTSDEADKTLAKDCEEEIKEALLAHGLSYDSVKYGEIRMNELRTLLGSDGICIPEHCFVDPPASLTRVREPLRPFIHSA